MYQEREKGIRKEEKNFIKEKRLYIIKYFKEGSQKLRIIAEFSFSVLGNDCLRRQTAKERRSYLRSAVALCPSSSYYFL